MPETTCPPVRPFTIDTHAHVFLKEVLGACGSAGPELTIEYGVQTFRAGSYTIQHVQFHNSPMSDPEQRLTLMDRMAIDFQILSPYPMLYFYDQPEAVAIAFCRRHNDAMAGLVRRFSTNSLAWRRYRCRRLAPRATNCGAQSKSSASSALTSAERLPGVSCRTPLIGMCGKGLSDCVSRL